MKYKFSLILFPLDNKKEIKNTFKNLVFLFATVFSSLLYSNLMAWSPVNGIPICTATGDQEDPQIVSDGSGGAIIAWTDYRNDTTGEDEFGDIYAQRVDSTGSFIWTFNGVAICTASNNQSLPTLVSDELGGAIITWLDERNGSTNNVYAQHVNSNGSTLWTLNGVAICTAANGRGSSTIATDGSSGAIITWEDFRNGNSNADIYAQRINSIGSTLWTLDGVAVCSATNIQALPTIVSDGSGGAIITWYDLRNENGLFTNTDIYAQRVDSTGNVLWSVNGVAICTASNNQLAPTIVSDGSGGAIITWTDERNGSTYNIYAQFINSSGSTLWTLNGIAICSATWNQADPMIVSDGSGGAIITWPDGRNGSTYNIYAQRVNSIGSTLWTLSGAAICTVANDQDAYKIISLVSDGSGGAIITWQDDRDESTYNIYAQLN
jgi:hypothetical protein